MTLDEVMPMFISNNWQISLGSGKGYLLEGSGVALLVEVD